MKRTSNEWLFSLTRSIRHSDFESKLGMAIKFHLIVRNVEQKRFVLRAYFASACKMCRLLGFECDKRRIKTWKTANWNTFSHLVSGESFLFIANDFCNGMSAFKSPMLCSWFILISVLVLRCRFFSLFYVFRHICRWADRIKKCNATFLLASTAYAESKSNWCIEFRRCSCIRFRVEWGHNKKKNCFVFSINQIVRWIEMHLTSQAVDNNRSRFHPFTFEWSMRFTLVFHLNRRHQQLRRLWIVVFHFFHCSNPMAKSASSKRSITQHYTCDWNTLIEMW